MMLRNNSAEWLSYCFAYKNIMTLQFVCNVFKKSQVIFYLVIFYFNINILN